MPKSLNLSDAEKLSLIMLSEIHKALKIKNGVDADFVEHAIYNGDTWALRWQMPGIFDATETPTAVVTATCDYLDMWDIIELSFENLSQADKDRLEKDVPHFGKNPRFGGFDGNNESEYLGVARMLVEKMDRWSRFKGRINNSHMPSIQIYARMYEVFEPMRPIIGDRTFSREELAKILAAKVHPSQRDKKAS